MPYIKHEDGFDAGHANHNASNSTLGGFDQLIRCRGHYPDPTPCDHVMYAWVPDEDVCENCTIVTEEEYDTFHDARVEHVYVNHFLPAIEAKIARFQRQHADAGQNIVNLEKERGRANAKAADILDASERIQDMHFRRSVLKPQITEWERIRTEHQEELEQVRRDIAAKGDSVRRRRLRQVDASTVKEGQ